MLKEVKARAIVGVGIERLWFALAKDVTSVVPKVVPNLVNHVEVIEGDGGLGTVFLFSFGSGESQLFSNKWFLYLSFLFFFFFKKL